jgi:RNase H-fold protein (predicted Holliday junction resolvase)
MDPYNPLTIDLGTVDIGIATAEMNATDIEPLGTENIKR